MNYKDIPGLVDYETREDVIDYAAYAVDNDMILVELGCYLGSTVARLAHKINKRKIDCKIFAIDNWICENISSESISWSNLSNHDQVYQKFLDNLKECGLSGFITPIKSDTTEAAKLFEDNSVDYIFFDANHGYGGLKAELEAWKPKLKEKALAACHDWPDQNIQKACIEVFGNCEVVRGGSSAWLRKTL